MPGTADPAVRHLEAEYNWRDLVTVFTATYDRSIALYNNDQWDMYGTASGQTPTQYATRIANIFRHRGETGNPNYDASWEGRKLAGWVDQVPTHSAGHHTGNFASMKEDQRTDCGRGSGGTCHHNPEGGVQAAEEYLIPWIREAPDYEYIRGLSCPA